MFGPETMISLLAGRIWYIVADTEAWSIASSRKAKGKAFCVKSGTGQAHGKLKNFLGNSPMRSRRARKQGHHGMAIAMVLIHSVFTLHCRNIYICVVATPYTHVQCKRGPKFIRWEVGPREKAYNVESWIAGMVYCVKRIEVDRKCMHSKIGTKKLWKKEKRNLHEEMEEIIGWRCVKVGRTRSTRNRSRW
jgi:hypothetical protein